MTNDRLTARTERTTLTESGKHVPHLNFHQTMWLTEGISPRERPVDKALHYAGRGNTWCDEYRWQQFLPLVWHARRMDYWTPMRDVVRRLNVRPKEWTESYFDLQLGAYSALMHMLLYAGDGRHPLQSIEELTYQDDEHVLYGGFTPGFKRCFRDMLTPMHVWWHGARGQSPLHTGMSAADLESDFCQLTDRDRQNPQYQELTWDGLHLSTHCAAPLGMAHSQPPSRTVSIRHHEPTVVTVCSPDYGHWMRTLRTMDLEGPTIAKVMFEDDEDFLDGPVLGFWLLQEFDEPKNGWKNNVRFITDAQAPAVLSLVRDRK